MRNALVIVIVCLSVSLLYDVYKEPIDRLLHLGSRQRRTDHRNRKQEAETKNRHKARRTAGRRSAVRL